MRTKTTNIIAALLLVVAAAAPSSAAYADPQLAPIPDMYLGDWGHHGAGITISRFDMAPESGQAIAQWRTYNWCQDPTTNKTNPPPCDMMVGHQITDGGIASIALMHLQGQDDRTLSGVVTATSDPSGFGNEGADVEFTMLPGNMLLVVVNGQSTMFCGPDTDMSLYPPSPCGA